MENLELEKRIKALSTKIWMFQQSYLRLSENYDMACDPEHKKKIRMDMDDLDIEINEMKKELDALKAA